MRVCKDQDQSGLSKCTLTLASLLVSEPDPVRRSVRDAILYRESLLRNQPSREDLESAKAYLVHLEKLLEFIKTEYKKIESKVGIPLKKILHSE